MLFDREINHLLATRGFQELDHFVRFGIISRGGIGQLSLQGSHRALIRVAFSIAQRLTRKPDLNQADGGLFKVMFRECSVNVIERSLGVGSNRRRLSGVRRLRERLRLLGGSRRRLAFGSILASKTSQTRC